MKCCKLPAMLVVAGILVGFGASTDDMKKFEGSWTLVSGEMAGLPMPQEDVLDSSLIVVGNAYTVKIGDMIVKGTQTLDSTASPKQINGDDTTGPNPGMTLGIYEFPNDDELRVTFSLPGHERPTSFATKQGTPTWSHVWKRVK